MFKTSSLPYEAACIISAHFLAHRFFRRRTSGESAILRGSSSQAMASPLYMARTASIPRHAYVTIFESEFDIVSTLTGLSAMKSSNSFVLEPQGRCYRDDFLAQEIHTINSRLFPV